MNSKKYRNDLYKVKKIKDLKQMIEDTVKLNSSKNAFLEKDKLEGEFKPITYKEFYSNINSLGTSFVNMGLKDKKIAVIGENSYNWVVTYFATVNGTGVIVPIDRELRAGEIKNLLSRAGISAVVYSKKMAQTMEEVMMDKKLKENIEYLIRFDLLEDEQNEISFKRLIKDGERLIEKGERGFLDAEINPETMAALLFTSGTTGLAKGVMLSHRNIVANVYNMSKYVKIQENGIGLSVLPMHHTYEMTCHVITGLYQGMTIAICEGLKYIQKNLEEVSANVMLAVPLIFETIHKKILKKAEVSGKASTMRKMINLSNRFKLYNRPWIVKRIFKDIHKATGGNITQFIAGGAAINPKVIKDYQAMGLPMIQGYGMTENSPILAVNKDRYSKAEAAGLVMPETEIQIYEPNKEGVGEILCKGPSVMIGYYENEEATKETIKDGWLFTGDYGYMDEDGFLYVSGRKKNVIVNKNGKNIFPEEVEYYLNESDYIAETLVHGIDGLRNDDVIVKAEIYPNFEAIYEDMGDISKEEIQNLINGIVEKTNDKMPNYKRVKRFHIRQKEFEKTTTRKVKRHLESNINEVGK